MANNASLEFAGVLFSPEAPEAPDAPRKMVGSLMVFRAENIDIVRKRIEADVYWSGNVVSIIRYIKRISAVLNAIY